MAEATAFLRSIEDLKASHNCWAYRLVVVLLLVVVVVVVVEEE